MTTYDADQLEAGIDISVARAAEARIELDELAADTPSRVTQRCLGSLRQKPLRPRADALPPAPKLIRHNDQPKLAHHDGACHIGTARRPAAHPLPGGGALAGQDQLDLRGLSRGSSGSEPVKAAPAGPPSAGPDGRP